jgi:hypothetical protein
MWDPFLVYADEPAEALDKVLAIKCRKASSYSRLIHAFHVPLWPEYPYLPVHAAVRFHTFKQLEFKKLQSLLLNLHATKKNYHMVSQTVGCHLPWHHDLL